MNKFGLRNNVPLYFEGKEYSSITALAKKLNISLPHVSKLLASGILLDEALKLCKRAKTSDSSVKSANTIIENITKSKVLSNKAKQKTTKNFYTYEEIKPVYAMMANEEIKALQREYLNEQRKNKLTLLLPKERKTFSSLANIHTQIQPALFELQISLKTGSLSNDHNIILIRVPKIITIDVTCASILSIYSYIGTDIKIEKMSTFLELIKPWDLHTGGSSASFRKFEEAVSTNALFFDLESEHPTNKEQTAIGKILRARRSNKLTVIKVFHERPLIQWCADFLLESLKEGMVTDISLFENK